MNRIWFRLLVRSVSKWDSTCKELTQGDWRAEGGTYQGDGSLCVAE